MTDTLARLDAVIERLDRYESVNADGKSWFVIGEFQAELRSIRDEVAKEREAVRDHIRWLEAPTDATHLADPKNCPRCQRATRLRAAMEGKHE
jgi:hypothetical protein